ncbi:hypothetical protein M413DRAFT_23171 [Hebeloma cylindrosporum]|uniref:Peptidase C14 caspase domain-containing protein n=1 Tax=Hebeloma cylindrosporum TaxID=76867 RepID=A0A0C3CSF0_HEBCY|nr:hypothetical protein M413DRAFT_23171 [Hebeloma cylindrosporum h7]
MSMKSRPEPRLFALVIGIGKYALKIFNDLPGAVPDANKIFNWLVNDLQVPRNQVCLITDEAASRAGIISALEAFRSDNRINEGDPIFIYYAGHGAGIPPPDDWECGGPGRKIQILVPQDYSPESNIHGIPDHVLGWLIHRIAEKKGDNITVVLDCCHSGSGTRSDPFTRVRCVELEPSMASFERPPRPVSLESHVLIAACGESELAREANGQGAFTGEFLELVRGFPLDALTYRDIPTRIKIPGQNPQVEGVNQHRYIFNSKAPSSDRPSHRARYDTASGLFLLNAGAAHGITIGAEFAFYADDSHLASRKPLHTFIVNNSASFFSTLRATSDASCQSIPTGFAVFQVKPALGNTFRLYLSEEHNSAGLTSVCHEILQTVHNVEFVNSPDDAHLEISVRDNQAIVSVRDRKAVAYGFDHEFPTMKATSLISFLEKGGCFYRERDRGTRSDSEVAKIVALDFYKLGATHSKFEDICEAQFGESGPNLHSADTIDFRVEEGCVYGVKLTNMGPHDLYPTLLYLDSSDLSIKTYYEPPFSGSNILEAPLKRNGGTLTIGYGSGGMPPFLYTVPGRCNVGFLKLLVSTRSIHSTAGTWPCLCRLEADGPSTLDGGETWGTLTIPMIQRRSLAQTSSSIATF